MKDTVSDAIQTFARRCREHFFSLSRAHALKDQKDFYQRQNDLLFKCSRIKEKLSPSAVIEMAPQACRIRRAIGRCAAGLFALMNPSLVQGHHLTRKSTYEPQKVYFASSLGYIFHSTFSHCSRLNWHYSEKKFMKAFYIILYFEHIPYATYKLYPLNILFINFCRKRFFKYNFC